MTMKKVTLKEAMAIIIEKTGMTNRMVMAYCIEDLRISLRLLKINVEITIK